jgi:hypothetical protein
MAKAIGRIIDGIVIEKTISGTWCIYEDEVETPVWEYPYGISCSRHGWNGNTSQPPCNHVKLVQKYKNLIKENKRILIRDNAVVKNATISRDKAYLTCNECEAELPPDAQYCYQCH